MRNLLRVIHILFWLSACSVNESAELKVFRYNQETSINSLDPAFAKDQANIRVVSQLFNGLIELDSQLNVRPGIAGSWEILDSGKLYRFYLRNDVLFHNDECMEQRGVTAHDFVYSFNRIIDPQTTSPGAWIFNDKIRTDTPAFLANGDGIFEIRLKKSFPPFLGMLGMPYCYVIPQEAVDFYKGEFRKHPVGTGPFAFEFWEEGVKLILKKNKDYFESDEQGEKLPYIDGIMVSFIENKQTAFLEFVQGNADYFSGLEGSFKDELLKKDGSLRDKYKGKFKLSVGPYLNTEYFGFFIDSSREQEVDKQLLNKYLRKAMSFSIDREKMMRYLRNNIGTPGNGGFIPSGLPGHEGQGYYKFNPDSAQYYLELAGFPEGKGLKTIKLYTNKNYTDLTIFLQKSLEQQGIPSIIEVNPGPFHRERVSKGQMPFFRASWLGDYPDAENYLGLFYSPNQSPIGPNYTHYHNDVFDSLYRAAMEINEVENRLEIYREMDRIAMEDAPVLVLFYDQTLILSSNRISGLPMNAMNSLVLKRLRIQ